MAFDEFCGRRRDEDRVDVGEPLDARREIDRLSDGEPVVRSAGTDVAYHRDARMKSHADVNLRVETLSDALVHELDALENAERGARRANRVVFVGHRVPEIRHHAVAEELRDVTLVAPDRVLAYAPIA